MEDSFAKKTGTPFIVSEESKMLEAWVREITVQDMPVFGSTARNVLNLSKDADSSVMELAQIILQDSTMTARILKLANTIFYNPNTKPISTVSRAIVLLGLEAVCNICLTIKLIDTLVKSSSRERLIGEMGLSIHAAVQARNIAKQRGDKEPEEVFVAALLMRVGRMAFWCCEHEKVDRLDELLATPGADAQKAEAEILGFPLNDLTRALAKEWGLGDLLNEALNASLEEGPRVRSVVIGNRLAEAAEKGWDSGEIEQLTEEYAELLGQPVETATQLLHDAAKDAALIACSYGASTAAKAIPLPAEYQEQVEIQDEPQAQEKGFPAADPMVQLDILREIKGLISNRPTFNALLEMVMEGIYRGIGMDRTLFALLSPDHKLLKAKYALGRDREMLMSRFRFGLSKTEPDIFLYAMAKKKPLRVEPGGQSELSRLVTPAITGLLGKGGFLIAPLVIGNKPIGIIYADRIPSGRKVDEDIFKSFEHFCAEANMGLEFIAKRGAGRAAGP